MEDDVNRIRTGLDGTGGMMSSRDKPPRQIRTNPATACLPITQNKYGMEWVAIGARDTKNYSKAKTCPANCMCSICDSWSCHPRLLFVNQGLKLTQIAGTSDRVRAINMKPAGKSTKKVA